MYVLIFWNDNGMDKRKYEYQEKKKSTQHDAQSKEWNGYYPEMKENECKEESGRRERKNV